MPAMSIERDAEKADGVPVRGLVIACYGVAQRVTFEAQVLPFAARVRRVVAEHLGVRASCLPCVLASTSARVRERLVHEGMPVCSLEEALQQCADQGIADLWVVSLQLIAGSSYRLVERAVQDAQPRFKAIHLTAPLLVDVRAIGMLAAVVDARYPQEPGRALVLVGHGAEGAENLSYLALGYALATRGRGDVLVGTLHAHPGVNEVLQALAARGRRRVLLVPCTLFDGVHRARDLGGADDTSWRSALERAGYAVDVAREGLSALPGMDELLRHELSAARLLPVSSGLPGALDEPDEPDELDASGRSSEAEPSNVSASGLFGEHARPRSAASRFPLMVPLEGARCLVVGAGQVGARRARVLLRHGARVTIVDPAARAEAFPGAVVEPRPYRAGDERDFALVVAATSNRSVNHIVGERCRRTGIPVSVADAAEEGTFVFPALCETDDVCVGVVSRDDNHARVAQVARAVRELLDERDG